MKKTKSVAFSLNIKLNFKILLVGQKNVGKTSLIIRFIKNTFQKNTQVTLGVEFYSKILHCNDGNEVTLQLWDTAGQENQGSITRSFYHLASCVFIIYDSPVNMQKIIDKWVYEINEESDEAVRMVLVRTKVDEIPIEAGQKQKVDFLVQKYQLDLFMSTSSKENMNVSKVFEKAGDIMNKLYKKDKDFRRLVDPKKDSVCLTTTVHPVHKAKNKKCCD